MCWSSNATLLIKSSEYDTDYTYTIARFLRIFDEIFDYAQCRKDAKWFGYFGKTEEKIAFLLALAMH